MSKASTAELTSSGNVAVLLAVILFAILGMKNQKQSRYRKLP